MKPEIEQTEDTVKKELKEWEIKKIDDLKMLNEKLRFRTTGNRFCERPNNIEEKYWK